MRTILTIGLCLGFVISAAAIGVAEPTVTLNVNYLDNERLLEGTYELTFEPETTSVYFMLLANLDRSQNPYLGARQQDEIYPFGFEPASLSVYGVELEREGDWETVPFRTLSLPPAWQTVSLEDSALAVDIPDDVVGTGSPIRLRCKFLTEIPRTSLGDNAITNGVLTWRFGWFPILLPDQASLVEIDDGLSYADRTSFPLVFPWTSITAHIEIPANQVLLSGADAANVVTIESKGENDARQEVTLTNESPSRSLGIAVGPEYVSYQLDGDIPIEVAVLPHHEEEARLFATLARDILAEYEDTYGPYPRKKLTIVENPNKQGQSFAADGIVWLSSRFFTHRNVLFPGALNRVAEYVLAHEIAHQWVGLGTGLDLNAEAWLSEGLAQYLAIRYFEKKYDSFEPNLFAPQSPGIAAELVARQFGYLNIREHFIELPYLLSLHQGFDEELVKPIENVQFGNASDVRLYDKGYLVARALAAHVSVEHFEQAIAQAIQERRADFLDARAFQAILEEVSGMDLEEQFDYWVFGPGWADYAIRIESRSQSELGYETVVHVTREGGTPQAVTIEATMQSGGTVRQTWDGSTEEATLVFRTPNWVARVSIDPDHEIPDRNRLNNHAPVKIVGAVNKNALPLDAYVLAPNDAQRGLIISYLDRLRVSITEQEIQAIVKLDRNQRISLVARFANLKLSGNIAYTWTEYSTIETGSAATTWAPTMAVSIAGERYNDENHGAYHALRIQALVTSPPDSFGQAQVMVRLSSLETAQAMLSVQDEVRLLPGVYLQGTARVGLSSGQLPAALKYALPELRSINTARCEQVAVAGLSLELPGSSDVPYSLLQLAMVDSLKTRGFVTAGSGWKSLEEFGTTSAGIEAGLEQIVELSTLGGMFSVTVKLGFATPIRGEGGSVFYATISL